MKKQEKKIKGSIDKKPPNLIRKQGGKPIIYSFAGGKNLQNLVRKTVQEN